MFYALTKLYRTVWIHMIGRRRLNVTLESTKIDFGSIHDSQLANE